MNEFTDDLDIEMPARSSMKEEIKKPIDIEIENASPTSGYFQCTPTSHRMDTLTP